MNKVIIKKIVIIFFSIIALVLLLVLLRAIEERKLLTKKYENAFLDFLTTGQKNECVNSDREVQQYKEARGLIELREIKKDISYLVNDYIDYIMKIYMEQNKNFIENVSYKYNNKNFHNKNNKMKLYNCGWVEKSWFVKASLSELDYELSENKLLEILENVIYHEGNDRYSGWIIFGDRDFRVCLPGGIVIEHNKPKKIYPKRDVYYKSVKILSPIYKLNILNNKKKLNKLKVRVDYIENNENKKVEVDVWPIRFEYYSLYPIFTEIYDYNSDFGINSATLCVYCEKDKEVQIEEFKRMDEDKYVYAIPDAVHNACIGNYDVKTFTDNFKEKIKKEGLIKNCKIKNTLQIDVGDIEFSGKELRELTLDDDTKIYCLFKIIYPGEKDFRNYTLEDVSDILIYIIPEDKMNLSYEEMYQLAFND